MNNPKKKILVVEDDKFLMKSLKDKLAKEGFDVIIALDGEEALLSLKESKPDILLLDLVMPTKDGFQVLEEMKLDNSIEDVPVVILSNLGQDSDIERGLGLGADDYLIKSDLTMNDLVDKINENLAKRGPSRGYINKTQIINSGFK